MKETIVRKPITILVSGDKLATYHVEMLRVTTAKTRARASDQSFRYLQESE